jgi:hypothetical protein
MPHEHRNSLRGTISPADFFHNHSESFAHDRFQIKCEGGVLEINYEDPALEDKARELAHTYVAALSLLQLRRFTLQLSQPPRMDYNGVLCVSVEDSGTIRASESVRITAASSLPSGEEKVMEIYDSRNLHNAKDLVTKALKCPPLQKALEYFAQEVVDDERPLYGIFKALEVLAKDLGKNGREELGRMAERDKKYVDEVFETTQIARHSSGYDARQKLSAPECRERARELILAYSRNKGTIASDTENS